MSTRNFSKNPSTSPTKSANQRLAETLALTVLLPVRTTETGEGLQCRCRIPPSSSPPSSASLPLPITPACLHYNASPVGLDVGVANEALKLLDVLAPGVPTNRVRREVKDILLHRAMRVPLPAMLGLCKSWSGLNLFQKSLLVAGSELEKGKKAWALTLNLTEAQQARAVEGVKAGRPLSEFMEREMKMLAGLGTVVVCLELTEAGKRPHLHAICFTNASRAEILKTIQKAAQILKIDPRARRWHCDRREAVFPPGWLDYMFKTFDAVNRVSASTVYISTSGRSGGEAFGAVLNERVNALFRERLGTQGKSFKSPTPVKGISLADHRLAALIPPAWLAAPTH